MRWKFMAAKYGAASLLLVPQMVIAGTFGDGYITDMLSIRPGVLIFYMTGARNSPPACANQTTRLAVDVTTLAGQSMQALAMTAYTLHKPVFVQGAGACDAYGDTESVNYIWIKP